MLPEDRGPGLSAKRLILGFVIESTPVPAHSYSDPATTLPAARSLLSPVLALLVPHFVPLDLRTTVSAQLAERQPHSLKTEYEGGAFADPPAAEPLTRRDLSPLLADQSPSTSSSDILIQHLLTKCTSASPDELVQQLVEAGAPHLDKATAASAEARLHHRSLLFLDRFTRSALSAAALAHGDKYLAEQSGSADDDSTYAALQKDWRNAAEKGDSDQSIELTLLRTRPPPPGYAGGGFMMGSQGGGSQSSPGGGKRSGTSALRPVTIHQLHSATQAFAEAEFYVDNAELKDIALVACIRNISHTQTQMTMLIEDGTGQIDARMWKDPNAEETGQDEYQLNTYVRIIGALKTFSNKRHVSANRVRPIEDFNEILFHPIECIYVHKYYTEGPPGGGAGGTHAITHTTYDSGANPYAGGGGLATSHDDIYADLPSGQRTIMTTIAQQVNSGQSGEEGVNINAVIRAIGGNPSAIRNDIETLVGDGHLYQTIDDDHVLPTAS
ncbi:Replication factor A protein 2 [Rhodotorula toruloides]|nr:Replication factor A protein 2 [Rhodotorula toruloides]